MPIGFRSPKARCAIRRCHHLGWESPAKSILVNCFSSAELGKGPVSNSGTNSHRSPQVQQADPNPLSSVVPSNKASIIGAVAARFHGTNTAMLNAHPWPHYPETGRIVRRKNHTALLMGSFASKKERPFCFTNITFDDIPAFSSQNIIPKNCSMETNELTSIDLVGEQARW